MDQRLMPDCLDIREITFTNLLLLGFDPNVWEAKYKCPFNRDMFAFPNKKAMEAVFYFLFNKLNADVTRDEFRNCWPIYDKKQESAFRKVVVAWLNRISKEALDSHMPRVVPSVLLSPGGDKFYNLLFCFSSYVLKEDLKRISGKGNIILPWPLSSPATKSLRPQLSKILTTKMVCESERFLENVKLSTAAQDQWVSYASDLTKENRAIRKAKRDLEKSLKDMESEHLRRGLLSPAPGRGYTQGSPYAGEVKSLKRTKIIQRVRNNWNQVRDVYESQKLLRERISEMMKENPDKLCLRGSDIDVKIPDLLIRDCDEEIYQRKIENTYEGGRVNLLSLVQLWNLSLHLILEQFKSHPLPAVAREEQDVRRELHSQSGYLQSIQSLKEILKEEMIPELKDSIEELKEILDHEHTPTTMKEMDFSLTGLPATPSVHLDSSPSRDNDFFAFTRQLFPNENGNVPTPEAIERMMQSLRDIAITRNQDTVAAEERPAIPSMQRRIPVPKSKTGMKPKSAARSTMAHNASFKKPQFIETPSMRSRPAKQLERTTEKSVRRREPPSTKKRPKDSVQEFLVDKITTSVLSQMSPSDNHSSNSSRCNSPQDHALADPLSALAEDAFQPQNKLARTPSVKLSEDPPRERVSSLDFESYLSVTTSKEPTSPARRLFSESFAVTPEHWLTTKHVDIDSSSSVFASPFHMQNDSMQNSFLSMRANDENAGTEDLTLTPMADSILASDALKSKLQFDATPLRGNTPFIDDRFDGKHSKIDDSSRINSNVIESRARLDQPINRPLLPDNQEQSQIDDSSRNITSQAESNHQHMVSDMLQQNVDIGSNADKTPGQTENTVEIDRVKEVTEPAKQSDVNKSNFSDINDIIKRYTLLKSKSKAMENTRLNSVGANDSDMGLNQTPTPLVREDNLNGQNDAKNPAVLDTSYGRASMMNSPDDAAISDDSIDGGDATPSEEAVTNVKKGDAGYLSFLKKARNSAHKDVLSWRNLKANVSMDLSGASTDTSNIDEIGELTMSTAKPLSFLQVDTRDLIRKSQLAESHSQLSKSQPSAKFTAGERPSNTTTPLSHVNRGHRRGLLDRPTSLDSDSTDFLISESPLAFPNSLENSFDFLTPGNDFRASQSKQIENIASPSIWN